MRARLLLAFIIVAAALLFLVIRIVVIIYADGDDYSKTILSQQNYNSTTIPFKRGTILDRNQTVLAASEQVYNLILDPSVINQCSEEGKDASIAALCEVFGYEEEELRTILTEKADSSYVRRERNLSKETKEAFEEYEEAYNAKVSSLSDKISGVWFEPEYQRVYPYETLACTALGFSGSDSSQGNWGIEQYYNDELIGTDGREYGYTDSDGVVERTVKEAQNGSTIVTTLDYTIQKVVEEAIADYLEERSVDNLGVLVMDPNTAEILAMATDSVYDLNNPSDLSNMYTQEEIEEMNEEEISDALNSLWRNFTISDTYEPGSTAKTLTVAAALEEDVTSSGTVYYCDGGQQVADWYIRCSHNHGDLTLEQALGFSCNDTMMQLASKMGKQIFSSYQTRFGLGYATGVDLPGEATGLLYSEDEMGSVDLATNAFGQNFTATMIQMASAYCSILNGGSYYQPHIVKQILSEDGEVIREIGSTVVRRTVSSSTVDVLKTGLQMAVEDPNGTGTLAQIQGYTVGGKTGTAEKYPRGNNEYVLSFMGFTTLENPQVLVYVVIDNPKSTGEEEEMTVKEAVILEQKIMSSILDYMNIAPDNGEPADRTDEEEEEEDEDGSEPETDEDGEPAESEDEDEEEEEDEDWDSEDSDEDAVQEGPWEDEVPEGGYVEGGEEALPDGTGTGHGDLDDEEEEDEDEEEDDDDEYDDEEEE